MPKKIYSWEFWAVPKFIQLDKRLNYIDKMVMSVLVTRMNGENHAKVKQQTISEDLRVSLSAVSKSIKKLEKLEMIENSRIGKKMCNQYRVTL